MMKYGVGIISARSVYYQHQFSSTVVGVHSISVQGFELHVYAKGHKIEYTHPGMSS